MRNQTLPTFTLAVISWAVAGFIILYLPPKNFKIIGVLFLNIFFAFGTTSGLLFYTIQTLTSDKFVNRKKLFQENLRRGFLTSTAVTVVAGLKIIDAYTTLNAFLLLLTILMIEVYFSKIKTN